MIKRLTEITISVVICMFLVVLVAIPIISGLDDQLYKTTNNESEIYSIAVTDSSTTITLEVTSNGVYTINGVEYEGSDTNNQNFKFYGENFGARLYNSGGTNFRFDCAFMDDNPEEMTASASTNKLVYSEGKITFTSSEEHDYTVTSSFFLYPDNNGTYGEYNMNSSTVRDSVYINNDSVIYLGCTGKNYIFASGTIDDLNYVGELVYYNSYASTHTFNSLNVTTEETDDGLTYRFDSTPYFTLNVVADETTTNVNATAVYVPLEYKYVDSTDGAIKTMIETIPLLLVVALIIALVSVIFVSRTDW